MREEQKPEQRACTSRLPGAKMERTVEVHTQPAFFSPHTAMKCALGSVIGGGRVGYKTFIKVEQLERLYSERARSKKSGPLVGG